MVTDAYYADNLALRSDKIVRTTTLKKAASSIDLYINAKKTESIIVNCRGQIQTSYGYLLKKKDHFTYLSSNIASTDKDMDIRIKNVF